MQTHTLETGGTFVVYDVHGSLPRRTDGRSCS
jgi:hypothetical protein